MVCDDREKFDYYPPRALTQKKARDKLLKNPGFGRVFTDHMVTIKYSKDSGWHDARIEARASRQFEMASSIFHYAQEIFEGLKAYRLDDGSIALFRAELNARRFQNSAKRLAMPPLPESLFLQACRQLISIDRAWIPSGEGEALYLRPFMFSTGVFLGVRPSEEYIFCVIASCAGDYFKTAAPLSLWVTNTYSRAGPGGTGDAKCGGNYAASLIAQVEATARGCDQVVFLDAIERRWIEELGGMNIFFVMDDGSIVTPPLTGTILPGITRSSIIALAQHQGISVKEEMYSIEEWRVDAKSGRCRESFACGTASGLADIGNVSSIAGEFEVGDTVRPVTQNLREALIRIQRGRENNTSAWMEVVNF